MATTPAGRARIAVAVLFAINGLLPAAWIARLAEIQDDAGLDDAQLGIVMAMGAVGGLSLGLLAGPLVARWGSGRVAVIGFLGMAPATALIGFESTAVALGVTMFWIFGFDAVMDAAMNAHSIRVEKAYRRSILNSFHGWWSLGTVAGSSLAAISASIGLALGSYLVVLAAILMITALVTWPWLMPGPDPDSHLQTVHLEPLPADAGLDRPTSTTAGRTDARWWRGAAGRRAALVGAFIFLAVIVEDVPARWSSIYLTDIGATGGAASLGLVAFTVGMTLGRFLADRVVDRRGAQRVVAVGMGVSAVVLAGALLLGSIPAYLIASFVVGFGVAPLFPAAINAAAHVPGLRPATGIALVSWLSRAGFLVAPIAVGLIAQSRGIAWGVGVTVVAAALLVPLSRVVRRSAQP